MKSVKIALLAALALACSSTNKTAIEVFAATPDTVENGSSAQLVFAAANASKLTIDNGVGDVTGKTTVAVTPTASTTYTLSAQGDSGTVTATATVTVTPAHAAGLTVAHTGATTAGAAGTFTVTAVDSSGATKTSYAGTVHFSSGDAQATLPADYTFTSADHGKHDFSVTFKTAGMQILGVHDTSAGGTAGSAVVTVVPAAASQVALTGLAPQATAGDALAATVTVRDAFANLATNYTGTIHWTSNDPAAVLPADHAFTAADAGVHSFPLSPRTAANTTFTATDTSTASLTANGTVAVSAGPASRIAVAATGLSTAGVAVSATATVRDLFGNVATGYTGTVSFASSDPQAVLPAAFQFTAAEAGVKTFAATLKTAGSQTITAADAAANLAGSAAVAVSPAAVSALVLSGAPSNATAGSAFPLAVAARDPFGNVVPSYTGTVQFTSTDPAALLPAATSFNATDGGHKSVSAALITAGSSTVTVTDASVSSLTATTGDIAVKWAAASHIAIDGLPAEAVADDALSATVTVKDSFGNVVQDYAGTLHFVLTDAAAPVIDDVTLTNVAQGTTGVAFTFYTAGPQSLMVSDAANAATSGSTQVVVHNEPASAYALSSLPIEAVAGEPLPLTITAKDRRGNVAVDYAGVAHVTSGDPTDLLPAAGGFVAGLRAVSIAFVTAADHSANVTDGGLIAATTSTVTIDAAAADSIQVSSSNTTAGIAVSVATSVLDVYGNVVKSYAGTVHFTSSDAQATLPADFTFSGADAGQHTFSATLKTASTQTLSIADAAAANIRGFASIAVAAAAASQCAVLQLPASAAAGAQVGARVTALDPFGNVATGYTGTIAITTTDPAAQAPGAVVYTAGDAGSRIVALRLVTAGARSITATDSTAPFTCTNGLQIVPGATVLAVTLPSNANAGAPQSATVRAQDAFGNAIVGYNSTVQFSSSDGVAVLPANFAFTGGEANSTTTVGVTFNTVGSQSFTATQSGAPATTGSAATTVHGFVYTNPPSAFGKVQLIVNSAASNASVVQLDLIANFTTFITGARNGAYSAGMNLPLDPTRAMADTTLLLEPATAIRVLNTGSAPKAVAASLVSTGPSTAVLYSGISQKHAGAGAVTTDAAITFGRTFYSVRLRLPATAAVGTVFDGNSLPVTFRAAVRDRSVSDVVSQADFAIGKLEVR
jgi:hypothetical protein